MHTNELLQLDDFEAIDEAKRQGVDADSAKEAADVAQAHPPETSRSYFQKRPEGIYTLPDGADLPSVLESFVRRYPMRGQEAGTRFPFSTTFGTSYGMSFGIGAEGSSSVSTGHGIASTLVTRVRQLLRRLNEETVPGAESSEFARKECADAVSSIAEELDEIAEECMSQGSGQKALFRGAMQKEMKRLDLLTLGKFCQQKRGEVVTQLQDYISRGASTGKALSFADAIRLGESGVLPRTGKEEGPGEEGSETEVSFSQEEVGVMSESLAFMDNNLSYNTSLTAAGAKTSSRQDIGSYVDYDAASRGGKRDLRYSENAQRQKNELRLLMLFCGSNADIYLRDTNLRYQMGKRNRVESILMVDTPVTGNLNDKFEKQAFLDFAKYFRGNMSMASLIGSANRMLQTLRSMPGMNLDIDALEKRVEAFLIALRLFMQTGDIGAVGEERFYD